LGISETNFTISVDYSLSRKLLKVVFNALVRAVKSADFFTCPVKVVAGAYRGPKEC
jgi:hypothetical protein